MALRYQQLERERTDEDRQHLGDAALEPVLGELGHHATGRRS